MAFLWWSTTRTPSESKMFRLAWKIKYCANKPLTTSSLCSQPQLRRHISSPEQSGKQGRWTLVLSSIVRHGCWGPRQVGWLGTQLLPEAVRRADRTPVYKLQRHMHQRPVVIVSLITMSTDDVSHTTSRCPAISVLPLAAVQTDPRRRQIAVWMMTILVKKRTLVRREQTISMKTRMATNR